MTLTPRDLDPVLHSAPRIEIVGRLVVHEHLRFSALQRLTGLTGGTLSSHLAVLEKAGYLHQRDAIIRLRPGKLVGLTPLGRRSFEVYLAALERLVAELRGRPTGSGDVDGADAGRPKAAGVD